MHSTLVNSKHSSTPTNHRSREEGRVWGHKNKVMLLNIGRSKGLTHSLHLHNKIWKRKNKVSFWNWVAKDTTWIKDATCWSKIRTHHRKCKSGDSPKTIVWSIMAAFRIGLNHMNASRFMKLWSTWIYSQSTSSRQSHNFKHKYRYQNHFTNHHTIFEGLHTQCCKAFEKKDKAQEKI